MNQIRVPELVVATANTGKIAEFRAMLPACVMIYSLSDLSVVLPPETGRTRSATTRWSRRRAPPTSLVGLRLRTIRASRSMHSMARQVCARRGSREIRQTIGKTVNSFYRSSQSPPDDKHGARFRSAVAVATPDGEVFVTEGTLEGAIGRRPAGTNGFGYDPIFVLADGRTLAEVLPNEKNRISHRARAYERMLPTLLRLLGLTKEVGTCIREGTTPQSR